MTEVAAFSTAHVGMTLAGDVAEAIVASDADGTVRFWNPGAERVFGYAAAEALGQSLDLIIPERLRARHWSGYRAVMAGTPSRYSAGALLSVPALRKDGTPLSVQFTITPLRSAAGDIVGLVAVMRDATAAFEETKALRRSLAALTATQSGVT